MSSDDVYSDEMSSFRDMNERQIKRLFAGHALSDDPEVSEVAEFFEDFAHAYPEVSTANCEAAHVSAMVSAAQLLAEKGEPVARPASKANGPAKQASGLPKPRRSIMWRLSHVRLAVKVAAPLVAVFVAFTGVALAGALPDPVQHAVSRAADAIGIPLPDPDDAAIEPVDDGAANDANDAALDDGALDDVNDASGAAVDDVNEGAVDDVDDGAVDDVDDGAVDDADDGALDDADDGALDDADDGAVDDVDDGAGDETHDGAADDVDDDTDDSSVDEADDGAADDAEHDAGDVEESDSTRGEGRH